MTTDVERLLVRLEVTQNKFEKQMAAASRKASAAANGIEKNFQRMNRNVGSSLTGVTRKVRELALVGGTGLGAREIAQYADAWTVAGNKIAAAGQVAGRSGRSLEEINDIADASRSGFTETADLYAKLLRATKDVAESEEEVAAATEITAKAFKAGGAAASEQAAGILQLGQALSSGFLQGDELRSLRENAPLVAQAIANEFETTIGGLKQLGAEGELTADRVFRAILNAQEPIEAAFATTNATIGESFLKLRNAITEYIGDANESSGATQKIAVALEALADNLDIVTAAGIALGARFIGPVLLRQLSLAVPAIRAASAGIAGMGVAAGSAAAGLGLIRGVLGVFGGPIGLAITALTALPLVLGDSSDGVERLDEAGTNAISSLREYAKETKKAADEQENLGGKVSAATQQILNQSRAQLQESLRTLREEYAELKADLEDGIGNGNITDFAFDLELAASANNAILGIAESLLKVADGSGDFQEISSEMERLAGIGAVATQKVSEFDTALENAGEVDLDGAVQSLVSLAEGIGGFGSEINAINEAEGLREQLAAAVSLRNSLEEAAEAGAQLRTENGKAAREAVAGAADAKSAQEAVLLALEGNTEEALRLAAGIDGAADSASDLANTPTPDYSGAAASAANLADQLGRAVSNAARLANAQVSAVRQSEINRDFAGDSQGRAAALARERFDASVGDTTGADSTVLAVIEQQRRAYVEGAVAIEQNVAALDKWNEAQKSAGSSGGGGGGGSARAASQAGEAMKKFTGRLDGSDVAIRRQIESAGKSAGEIAALRSQYELLDLAAQNNIDLNEAVAGSNQTVGEAIAATSREIGALTSQYEANEIGRAQLEDGLDGLSGAFTDALTGGQSLRNGLANVFNDIANDILKSGIRSAIEFVLTPRTSAASGGGILGGLLGGLGSLFGFERGGYTGDGGKSEPAGVVHKGEYVFTKAATSRIGVNNLERIQRGALPGYMTGGLVTNAPSRASRAMSGEASKVDIDIYVKDDGKIGAIARASGAQAGIEVSTRIVDENNASIPGMVAEAQARA